MIVDHWQYCTAPPTAMYRLLISLFAPEGLCNNLAMGRWLTSSASLNAKVLRPIPILALSLFPIFYLKHYCYQ